MSVVVRGMKNAFRSGIRTTAVILILAISMGVALSMLLANQAVRDRLNEVKKNVGTTVMIHPAGARGSIGGGEPLKNEDIAKLADVEHVSAVSSVLTLFLTTEADDVKTMNLGGLGIKQGKTNLKSAIDPGTIGQRAIGNTDEKMPAFRLPVRAAGISGDRNEQGQLIKLTSGRQFTADDKNVALLGKDLAEENGLTIDSTFKAYDETFTVVGIFDEGTEFGNDAAYIPLATAQRLGEADGEITSAVAIVDSIDNMESTTEAIKDAIGTDKADVTATDPQAMTAVDSLRSVEKVSVVGFVIALGAAGIIILLTMLMIVRERRREIGVLKAIGGSNRTIVTQFVVEAMVLVLVGATVGMGVAAASSNSIANALVTSNSSQTDTPEPTPPSAGGTGPRQLRLDRAQGPDITTAKDLVSNVTTNVSLKSLGYGLLAALIIAFIGSAVPAWFITKIRPAEVLRGE